MDRLRLGVFLFLVISFQFSTTEVPCHKDLKQHLESVSAVLQATALLVFLHAYLIYRIRKVNHQRLARMMVKRLEDAKESLRSARNLYKTLMKPQSDNEISSWICFIGFCNLFSLVSLFVMADLVNDIHYSLSNIQKELFAMQLPITCTPWVMKLSLAYMVSGVLNLVYLSIAISLAVGYAFRTVGRCFFGRTRMYAIAYGPPCRIQDLHWVRQFPFTSWKLLSLASLSYDPQSFRNMIHDLSIRVPHKKDKGKTVCLHLVESKPPGGDIV